MINKAYTSILRMKLIAGLQYRVAAVASTSIQLFWGLILSVILTLFYQLGNSGNIEMNLAQGITYIWFGQCFLSIGHFSLDSEMYHRINSGDYAYELCRPLDLYNHLYMRAAALRLSGLILKSSLGLIVALVFIPTPYKMMRAVSITALLLSILTLIIALLLSCAIANLFNILLFKVEYGLGIFNLASALVILTNGTLIPLYVYPDWLQRILRLLPFAGLIDFPASLYIGMISPTGIWFILVRQITWIIILVLLGKWLMKLVLRKTIIQGG